MGTSAHRPTDEELFRKAQAGDVSAFDSLVRRYWKRICGYAFTMLRSLEEAEDATQETFLKAFSRRKTFEEGRRLAPWLFRIAAHSCIDTARGRKNSHASIDDIQPQAPEETPLDLYEQNDIRARVREAILSLPEPYRQVLYLRYADGMSYQEIASALDITLAAVETRLFRGKQMIRRLLGRSLE